MNNTATLRLEDLHAVNPYEGFPIEQHPEKVHGWNSDSPVFGNLIKALRPRLVVEVGTWLGASAIQMGDRLRELPECVESKIVCVDTWLGALEFWVDQGDPTRYQQLNLVNGYPSVYRQFLANVMHRGHAGRVIPFPQTSLIAARWFARRGCKIPMIYLDASHDYDDVMADLAAWWPLVEPGGVLFGDDWGTWQDVQAAVTKFSKSAGEGTWRFSLAGNHWILRKEGGV